MSVISMPPDVKCTDDPAVVVGVRFTRAARRVVSARAQRVIGRGEVLDAGHEFRNSSRWQFATLRLPACGQLHEVEYVFFREGDRDGQTLGLSVCVLGPRGEDCPGTDEQ